MTAPGPLEVRTSGEAGLLRDPVLAEIVRRLVLAYAPERVYLFGSRARGDAGETSDYDVLVLVPRSDDSPERRARRPYRVLDGIPAAVDVLIWTRDEFDERLSVVTSLPATVAREAMLLHAA